jgi:hypothetical protein
LTEEEKKSPETRAAVRRMRYRLFLASQVLLFAGFVAITLKVDNAWIGSGWGVTMFALIATRFGKHDLAREKAEVVESTEFDKEAAQALVAEGAMNMTNMITPILEAAQGHRATLRTSGWSEDAAERMAVSFYQAVLHSFIERAKSS